MIGVIAPSTHFFIGDWGDRTTFRIDIILVVFNLNWGDRTHNPRIGGIDIILELGVIEHIILVVFNLNWGLQNFFIGDWGDRAVSSVPQLGVIAPSAHCQG